MVALGGHLLAHDGLEDIGAALDALAGDELVFTHGNGPQVGERYPDEALHAAVARTQAEIGAELAVALEAVCVITHVVVDPADPAFGEPTKPIGPWLDERPDGDVIHDEERGWRRVVASPPPLEIVELSAIRALVEAGERVIACGGGGIPVAGGRGVDAVIDKDRASALLAEGIGAERLVVLTDVDAVLDGGGAPIERLTPAEAEALVPSLPAGSMGPKVEACAAFVRATGGEALITSARALGTRAGTRIAVRS
ncbi:MAG: carbamate kinase [Gaiellaceae bacterium]